MTQRWTKLGLIYSPRHDEQYTHAAVPIADHISGDLFKIYFTSRDRSNRSITRNLVLDIKKPNEILELGAIPVLVPGNLGEFDDDGAMATWLSKHGGREYLYYIGWNRGQTVPFRNSIGLATADKPGEFARYSPGPILDRTMCEPHFVASCCVLPSSDKWRMWYLSCTGWRLVDNQPQHRYHIKYAESVDGVHWQRNGVVAIDYKNENEYAISRPSVMQDDDCWRMWYSYRGARYRIGYAESSDGIEWKRRDPDCCLNVSASGWDDEMIEYPHVFDHDGSRYMLYNGNGYGKTGFGLAVLES
ncbi:hypothetical protein [Agrobacterium cavarae]|uniref:hypothetical protein n=1 Tax=Agrobacterium cavarae TaxID=2528239 RepID=UPI000DDE1D39|nr:hypothetical protein [Agrobacterium cavarae]